MPAIRPVLLAGMAALCPVPTQAETPWRVELEAARTTTAAESTAFNIYPGFVATVPLSGQWSLGVEVYPEIYLSHTGAGWQLHDPYLDVVLTARRPGLSFGLDTGATWSRTEARYMDAILFLFVGGGWGRIDLGDTDGALGHACVIPAIGQLEDLALVSACPGQLISGVVRYTTPDGPATTAVSLGQSGGESAASAAVGHTLAVAGGDLRWGLAVEHVTGPAARTARQGGVIWTGDRWTLGLAAARVAGAGRDPWGVQAAATLALHQDVSLTLGLSTGRLAPLDGKGLEHGAGLSAAWAVTDRTTVSAGIARRWLQHAPPETRLAVGLTLTP